MSHGPQHVYTAASGRHPLYRKQRALQILAEEARAANISIELMMSPCKRHVVAYPRFRAIRKIYAEFPEYSMAELGRVVGMERTSVMHALGKRGTRLPVDLREKVA